VWGTMFFPSFPRSVNRESSLCPSENRDPIKSNFMDSHSKDCGNDYAKQYGYADHVPTQKSLEPKLNALC